MYAAPLIALVAAHQSEGPTVAAEQVNTDAVNWTSDSEEEISPDSATKRQRQQDVDQDADFQEVLQRKEIKQL